MDYAEVNLLEQLGQKLRPHRAPILLLIVIACAVYGRMLGHDFLSNWDDNRYILENADVQGFCWQRLKAIFSRYYVGNYAPIQMLSYMVDHALWGLRAGGYLLTNLLLHLANALILYRLLFRFIQNRLAALCGAALFLVHPVQVETVAWISQRKNLLALFFFLVAWECYIVYRATSQKGVYAGSLVSLLFGLLAKSVAVIFPVCMVLFDHCYPEGTARGRLKDKIPYVILAGAVAVIAILSQTPNYTEWGAGGGRTGYHGGSPWATFLTMLPVLCTYLRLIIWPTGLSALYSPTIHKTPDLIVFAAGALLAGGGYLLYRLYRHDRRIAFWPLFALVSLLPVSQIVPLVTLMNDRYLYFPLVGIAGLAAYAADAAVNRGRSVMVQASMAVILLILSVMSFQRLHFWRDSQTLWRDTVKKVPENPVAWEAMGESLQYAARPQYQEAIAAYRRALELNPGNEMSRYNLGMIYIDQNDYGNGEKIISELLQRSPNNVMGWAVCGDLALGQMDYSEAERRYKKALSLQPEAFQVYQKIGNLMAITGRIDEARDAYLRIEKILGHNDPQNAYELARIEALAGDTGASIKWLEVALQRGYNNYSAIMADEELMPIMSDGRFYELTQRYFPKQSH